MPVAYIEGRGPDAVVKAACLESRRLRFRAPSGLRGGSIAPVQAICAQRWPKTPFISFSFHCHKLTLSLYLKKIYIILL